ncbi:MAG: acyl--CoA ligase [Bdellovibrionales bacterium]|nr:acyl--CoA ligase [Bdellovibrionales bacterium]
METSPTTIRLWKGYHSPELLGFVAAAWRNAETLIVCPPVLSDLDFIPLLPAGEVRVVGDAWTEGERAEIARLASGAAKPIAGPAKPIAYPARPILGVFTSGTVGGKPRLVLYSKANVEASLEGILEVFDRDRIDAIFAYPQPFHTFGLVLGYVQAIATGRPLIAPFGRYSSDFHRAWRETASRHPGLLTLGTPTHFQDLLKAAEAWEPEAIPATYTTIIGGASVPRALWRGLRDRLRVAAPSIGYGCTEASPGLTHLPPGREPSEDGEIGGVLAGLSVEILPGTGLEFTGPQACLAIIQDGRIEFPRRILIRDRLGARPAPNGRTNYVFEGRYDLVFNRGGVKFSLEEIERFLRESFPASEFLAVAVADDRLGEDLGLLVRARESRDDRSAPSEEESKKAILAALHGKFRAHFDPARVLSVSELPTNAAAKPDRGSGARLLGEPR